MLNFNNHYIIVDHILEVYLDTCQRSKMKLFTKKVKYFQPLSIYAKSSILDLWQDYEYPLHLITFGSYLK